MSTFPMNHAIFLTSLIAALIVFPKYIPDLYVFLIRVFGSSSPPTCPSVVPLPSVQLTTRSFSRGTNSPHGDFLDETRYSQFRLTVAGIERQRPHPFCSLPPIDFTSLLDLLTSREYRLVSRFKLNFFYFFVSFAAQLVLLDQLANEIKWPSNRLVIVKPFLKTDHFNKKCRNVIFQSDRK